MRPVKVSLLLGALLVVIMPAPAHAWFGWLDNLSGPGPFMGDEIEIRLFCFGGEHGAAGESSQFVPAPVQTGCLNRRVKHNSSIDLITGAYFAIANSNIPYADPKVNRRTALINYGLLYSVALFDRRVDLKSGLEANYFYGPAFDNFTRLAVVAFFDWKPFARETESKQAWRDIVTLRLGALYFPEGFDSTDFGAIPGGFHTTHELIPFVGVAYDFGARK